MAVGGRAGGINHRIGEKVAGTFQVKQRVPQLISEQAAPMGFDQEPGGSFDR